MNRISLFSFAAVALLLTSLVNSQTTPRVDDSDLSTGEATVTTAPDVLKPDAIEKTEDLNNARKIAFQFLYRRSGADVPISGLTVEGQTSDLDGRIELECTAGKTWNISLENRYFKITGGGRTYQLELSAQCSGSYLVKFNETSANGQAISIFETFERGRRKLAEAIGLNFWKSKIKVNFPGDGDYYNWNTVSITNGHQWDVVAHEMGHAIYDQGGLGQFGGGEHKIDECYSKNLALSEGWASFYAGWLYTDLSDTDAKFQYLVPRRAPIRFENVPDDVCRQITNEWRVTAFFWDVIDLNNDGETSAVEFAKTWHALLDSGVSGVDAARARLEASGFDKTLTENAWKKNF